MVVAKGVSDHADWDKDDSYHHFAAKASAEFVLAFLRENVTPRPPLDLLVPEYEEPENTNPATKLNASFCVMSFHREARAAAGVDGFGIAAFYAAPGFRNQWKRPGLH